jgi:hypothetical protein
MYPVVLVVIQPVSFPPRNSNNFSKYLQSERQVESPHRHCEQKIPKESHSLDRTPKGVIIEIMPHKPLIQPFVYYDWSAFRFLQLFRLFSSPFSLDSFTTSSASAFRFLAWARSSSRCFRRGWSNESSPSASSRRHLSSFAYSKRDLFNVIRLITCLISTSNFSIAYRSDDTMRSEQDCLGHVLR